MGIFDFCNRFVDWQKNIVFDSKASFNSSYNVEIDMNIFKKDILLILDEDLGRYFIDNADTPLTKELFHINDLKDFEIFPLKYPVKEGQVEEAYIYQGSISLIFFSKIFPFDMLNTLACKKELYLATLGEKNYRNWQDTYGLSAYKFRRGLRIITDKNGEKIVDISTRPGRSVYSKNFWYYGASKMWFGPQIYPYIPQELILSFSGAVEIKILENNVTFVNLYESIYDGFRPHNQDVQKRFREHIGIDRLKID